MWSYLLYPLCLFLISSNGFDSKWYLNFVIKFSEENKLDNAINLGVWLERITLKVVKAKPLWRDNLWTREWEESIIWKAKGKTLMLGKSQIWKPWGEKDFHAEKLLLRAMSSARIHDLQREDFDLGWEMRLNH